MALIDSINRQLGISESEPSQGLHSPATPWNKKDPNEAFFKPLNIKPENWDKLFPYRLLVVDITKPDKIIHKSDSDGSPSSGNLKNTWTIKEDKAKNKYSPNGIEYTLSQSVGSSNWELNLPITPQMLRISDQFAINTSATMRGIVEEHNGVKFKMIQASGTTGIWNQRPSIGGIPKAPTALGSIFGGTLNQFTSVTNDLKRVGRAFSGSHPASVTSYDNPSSSGEVYSTGYYQALMMGQFLERYAQAKKNPKNKNWRLVFDIPKQNQSFIVTPLNFTLEQNQQKPMEYLWNVQFKAWKRIELESPAAASQELPKLTANMFQRITGTIRETRRALGNSLNLVKAVRSDFQKPLNVLRQTALAVKDLGGLAITAVDMPGAILDDMESSWKDSIAIIGNSFQRGPDGGNKGTSATGVTASGLRAGTQEAKAGIAANAVLAQSGKNEGLSQSAVAGGALGLGASQSLETDSTKNIANTPEEFFDLFDAIDIEDLTLSREQQEAIDNELERARLVTIDDFRDFRNDIENLALEISNAFGSGDSTYSDIYGRPDPNSRVLPMTLEENEILVSLFEAVQMFDLLTATKQFDDFSVVSPLEFVGGLANESGIDFDSTESKILLPVPFGLTIEEIAARYLQDPDKWVEIATINKLTSPYIDEEGFTYSLLSNGDGRQINVDDTAENLYIGQKITLKSDVTPQFTRKIINIEKIGDGNYLVSFDGLGDLDSLTTAQNATIQGYLPGTVNSQNQIYIPSNLPAQPDDRIKTPDHLDEDVLTRVSKIDWLLTDDGDLAINKLGDFRLANGLNNLVQALKIKVRTKKGTLMRHLDFGLGIEHGISIADIEAGDVIDAMNKMIEDDPRFSGIERIDIRLYGSTLTIDMAVNIANGSGVVPVTFDI